MLIVNNAITDVRGSHYVTKEMPIRKTALNLKPIGMPADVKTLRRA